jgi:hypothetical protein
VPGAALALHLAGYAVTLAGRRTAELEINCDNKNCHQKTVGSILALSGKAKRKCRFITVRARRYSYNSVVEG